MTTPRDEATQSVLARILDENHLGAGRLLYREAMRDSLTSTDSPGVYRLAANTSPGESVIDVYGPGYVVQAERVGPGLAFAEAAAPNWQETMELRTMRAGHEKVPAPGDRVEVAVRLEDLLDQDGLVYPVESVTVERAWYFTLPQGSVDVRIVT